jgi:neutral ceramidase
MKIRWMEREVMIALMLGMALGLSQAGCELFERSPVGAVEPWEAGAEPPLLVATAKADVTPNYPMGEAGGAHSDMVETSYRPIEIRVMTVGDGKQTAVIISGEFLYWDPGAVEQARSDLKARYDLEPSQIIMNATHTHNGPAYNRDESYKAMLSAKIAELVGWCLKEARPARLYFGRTRCEVGVCRRRLAPDGMVRWGINPWGRMDREVIVIKAVGMNGRPVGVLMNYACHPTTIRNNGFGGDFPGYAMEMVEEATGSVAIFLQGCAGDIKVHNARDDDPFDFTFDGGPERCADFARRFVEPVLATLEEPMEEINGPVRCALDTVQLPLMESRIDPDGQPPLEGPRRRMARLAKLMLAAMDDSGNYKKTRPCEVHVVKIGDRFRHVALNGEMCVGVQLRIKAQHDGLPVMVTAYTGPNIGYFPTADELHQLGYEVKASYSPEAEDFLLAKVMELSGRQDTGD